MSENVGDGYPSYLQYLIPHQEYCLAVCLEMFVLERVCVERERERERLAYQCRPKANTLKEGSLEEQMHKYNIIITSCNVFFRDVYSKTSIVRILMV